MENLFWLLHWVFNRLDGLIVTQPTATSSEEINNNNNNTDNININVDNHNLYNCLMFKTTVSIIFIQLKH